MTTRLDNLDRPLALLREANPTVEASSILGVEEALDGLSRAITRQPYASRARHMRHRRGAGPRLKVAVAIGIVALVAGGVATAAGVLPVYTGVFASGPDIQMGGPGENLNLAAPGFRSAALKLSSDIPYPAGYASWRDFVVTEQEPGPGGATAGDQVTTGALRGAFAASAFCAWVQEWRMATVAGESAEAQQAAAAISEAPSWSAVTAEDPHPSASAANDPGAEPGTLFGWMLPYRSAVLVGDPATVDQLLTSGYGDGKCWLADPQWMAALKANPAWSKLSAQQLGQRYRQFLAEARP
jgi:hypothetical protein